MHPCKANPKDFNLSNTPWCQKKSGPGTEYTRLSKRFLPCKATFSGCNSRIISMTLFLLAQTPSDRNMFQIFLYPKKRAFANYGENVIVRPSDLFTYLQHIKLTHFIHSFGMFQILFHTGLC